VRVLDTTPANASSGLWHGETTEYARNAPLWDGRDIRPAPGVQAYLDNGESHLWPDPAASFWHRRNHCDPATLHSPKRPNSPLRPTLTERNP